MITAIEIGRRLSGEALEKLLVETAIETGLSAISIDNYKKEYFLRDWKFKKTYNDTSVILKKGIFCVAEVFGIRKGEEKDWIHMGTGIHTSRGYFCFGSEKLIKSYLDEISDKLGGIHYHKL